MAQPEALIVADPTTANPIIYLQQVQSQYAGVYLSGGADLQAAREVVADVATVDNWLTLGRRVFIVSPQRQIALAEQLKETSRFRLLPRTHLYEILPADNLPD